MRYAFLLMGLLAFAPAALAQNSDTQSVTIVVEDTEAIEVTPSSLTLTLNAPVTIGDSLSVTDNSSSYALTVNTTSNKITGQLDADYSNGIVLYTTLAAPSGGTSAGETLLVSSAARDLVTGVASVQASGLQISYTAKSPATASSNGAGQTNTVTYTITDE